jgi:hypothetical protein
MNDGERLNERKCDECCQAIMTIHCQGASFCANCGVETGSAEDDRQDHLSAGMALSHDELDRLAGGGALAHQSRERRPAPHGTPDTLTARRDA